MMLSISLEEDAVSVIVGKAGRRIVIEDCHRYILPQGTLINGVVTGEEQFHQVLKEIKNTYKRYRNQVHLVLGSSQIITKIMEVPPLNQKQVTNLVYRELAHYKNEDGDMVYDYGVIRRRNQSNGGGTILGAVMERDKITGCKELFEKAGLRVKTINVSLNAVLQMVEHFPGEKRKTYILSILDGRNILSLLCIKGNYAYTGRYRFLHDRGTTGFLKELENEMEALRRFGKTLGGNEEIETIYFCGLNPDEKEQFGLDYICPELSDILQEGYPDTYHPEDYIYATGNLWRR